MSKHTLTQKMIVVGLMLGSILLALGIPSKITANSPASGTAVPGKSASENKSAAPLAPVGTGFTYQGRLEDGGSPANDFYDFQVSLYDDPTAGAQVGLTLVGEDVPVIDGLFSVSLDFGTSAFGGGARWLEIAVRPGSSTGAYTTLAPRQEISPAPYAMAMPNVYTDEGANFVGIGRDFRISGNEVFGVRYTGSPNQYGGMYVETSSAGGWPFYGYATNGSFRAWTYYNGATGDWSLYSGGIRLEGARHRRIAHRPRSELQPGDQQHHRQRRHPHPGYGR